MQSYLRQGSEASLRSDLLKLSRFYIPRSFFVVSCSVLTTLPSLCFPRRTCAVSFPWMPFSEGTFRFLAFCSSFGWSPAFSKDIVTSAWAERWQRFGQEEGAGPRNAEGTRLCRDWHVGGYLVRIPPLTRQRGLCATRGCLGLFSAHPMHRNLTSIPFVSCSS